MIFETTRDGALKKLDNFIENEIINYNSKRNFDFGPKERKNVSCLSPYITHRLITEYETVERAIQNTRSKAIRNAQRLNSTIALINDFN